MESRAMDQKVGKVGLAGQPVYFNNFIYTTLNHILHLSKGNLYIWFE